MWLPPFYSGPVEIVDKRSRLYRKHGIVTNQWMRDDLLMFYEVEVVDNGNPVRGWFDEKYVKKVVLKEGAELWKFFCHKDKALVGYTLAEEFDGEEEATMKSIASERGIPANEIDIRIGTINKINWKKGDSNEKVHSEGSSDSGLHLDASGEKRADSETETPKAE